MCVTAECEAYIRTWQYVASPCGRVVLEKHDEGVRRYSCKRLFKVGFFRERGFASVFLTCNDDGVGTAAYKTVLVNKKRPAITSLKSDEPALVGIADRSIGFHI